MLLRCAGLHANSQAGVAGSAGGYTAQAIGLEYTTASRGAFTGTFTVLAVPMLVRPFQHHLRGVYCWHTQGLVLQ